MVNKQLLNIQSLKNNLNVLKEQKEHYLAPSFLEQLENTAFELSEAINRKTDAATAMMQLAMPNTISASFIDLCLDSIESELKGLTNQAGQTEVQVANELAKIAYDLFCLSVYIRFTLDPIASSMQQNIFVVADKGAAENFSSQARLN